MPDNSPLITIAISCFNAAGTIRRAVDSAINQDWPETEIVVVDDCSTDASFQTLNEMKSDYPQLRTLRHEINMGIGATRNSLLHAATGEFVVFFDDDDHSQPERLTEQLNRIVTYEKATGTTDVACYTARVQVFEDGTTRYEPTVGMEKTPGPSGKQMADLILYGKPLREKRGTCASCSLMARRAVFERLGGFNPKLRRGEDTDFNLRLALAGGHFAGISTPLVLQTISITSDKGIDEERKQVLNRIASHREYLEQAGWFDFLRRWADIKFNLLEKKWISLVIGVIALILTNPIKSLQRFWWAIVLKLRNA